MVWRRLKGLAELVTVDPWILAVKLIQHLQLRGGKVGQADMGQFGPGIDKGLKGPRLCGLAIINAPGGPVVNALMVLLDQQIQKAMFGLGGLPGWLGRCIASIMTLGGTKKAMVKIVNLHRVVVFERIKADPDPIATIFGVAFKILAIELHIGKCAVDTTLGPLAKGGNDSTGIDMTNADKSLTIAYFRRLVGL